VSHPLEWWAWFMIAIGILTILATAATLIWRG
jgi:hypothetical protein